MQCMKIIQVALLCLVSVAASAQCPISISKFDREEMNVTVTNTTDKEMTGAKIAVVFVDTVADALEPRTYVIGNRIATNTPLIKYPLHPQMSPDQSAYPYAYLKIEKVHFKDGSDWVNKGECRIVVYEFMKEMLPADVAKLEGK